jgi:hypothetical protein
LRRSAGQKRLDDRRVRSGKIRVVREIGIANERADAYASVGQTLDTLEPRQVEMLTQQIEEGYARVS